MPRSMSPCGGTIRVCPLLMVIEVKYSWFLVTKGQKHNWTLVEGSKLTWTNHWPTKEIVPGHGADTEDTYANGSAVNNNNKLRASFLKLWHFPQILEISSTCLLIYLLVRPIKKSFAIPRYISREHQLSSFLLATNKQSAVHIYQFVSYIFY